MIKKERVFFERGTSFSHDCGIGRNWFSRLLQRQCESDKIIIDPKSKIILKGGILEIGQTCKKNTG